MPGHFCCCYSIRSALAPNGIEVFVSASRLWIPAVALVKKHCIPFSGALLHVGGGSAGHRAGNEVLRE